MRDWAKKINKNSDIRQLQRTFVGAHSVAATGKKRTASAPHVPFISVSARSEIGAQIEVWFSHLPLDELDWDETMYSLMVAGPR